MKKIPERTCVVTREKLPKMNLIRVVRSKDGEIKVDLTGKLSGRGAYIKKDLDAVSKAKKSKALEKHLEVSIPDEVYAELNNVINEE